MTLSIRSILVCIALVACGFAPPPRAAEAAPATPAYARATAALDAFIGAYWDPSAGHFRAAYPPDGRHASYWFSAHALDGVLDGIELSSGTEKLRGIVTDFCNAQDRRGWIAGFFDDECWMTLALLRAHAITGDPAHLARARALYRDIVANAWDATPLGPLRAGAWWDRAHTQKATAANAGAALAAARMHRATGEPAALAFARRVYGNWRDAMTDPATGQVWDHVTTAGQVVRWKFTYNEGLMVGAALELARATGEPSFLADARRHAAFMVACETTVTRHGRVLFDGAASACTGDCHQLKGIGFRYLALLWMRDPQSATIGDVLRASSDSIWEVARNPDTGLFGIDWSSPPALGRAHDIAQDSAAVMALAAWAAVERRAP
jgi:predicted alpha-1,6-mannanase (GH76 family)